VPAHIESLVSYTDPQFALVLGTLSVGAAAHLAAIAWFLHNRQRLAPRYQSAAVMSIFVMISSGILLFRLAGSFSDAFVWDGSLWVLGDATFLHGYRYLNWIVTVPVLLSQLVFALALTPDRARVVRLQLVASGVAMVLLGYVGQLYETTQLAPLLVWGTLSTFPFAYLLWVIFREVGAALPALTGEGRVTLSNLRLLILFSWGLYPVAYLVAAVQLAGGEFTANGVIVRTVLFTLADVLSKVVYGVLLGKVLLSRSVAEGWEPAIAISPEIAARTTG
jgi:bacteriorhodopsin